ncbi:MAG: ribonuclease H [Candidatus Binatia bacterium]
MNTNPVVVFTDGAAKGNPGPGGWGAIIATPDGHVTELGGAAVHTTNNRMELTAPLEALHHLRHTPGRLAVHTDSTYVIKGIREWVWAWRRRGWKTAEGAEVLNRDLWERLASLVTARGKDGVAWHYVRGHCGIPGNDRVDEIADAFARRQRPELYDGPLLRYPIAVHDIPNDTRVPQRTAGTVSGTRKAAAYSYLSVVDGKLQRHASWADCERRVKGRARAKFKKAMSAAEEAAILRAWGFAPTDL